MQLAHTILIAAMVNAFIALPVATEANAIRLVIKFMGKADAVDVFTGLISGVPQTQRVPAFFNVRKYERNCH